MRRPRESDHPKSMGVAAVDTLLFPFSFIAIMPNNFTGHNMARLAGFSFVLMMALCPGLSFSTTTPATTTSGVVDRYNDRAHQRNHHHFRRLHAISTPRGGSIRRVNNARYNERFTNSTTTTTVDRLHVVLEPPPPKIAIVKIKKKNNDYHQHHHHHDDGAGRGAATVVTRRENNKAHHHVVGNTKPHQPEQQKQPQPEQQHQNQVKRRFLSIFRRSRNNNSGDENIPDVKKVLAFAIPAIGVWMYMPLLSMIDTSCVGKLATTSQLAALNPAIAVINYSAKLLCFLYTGTLGRIGAASLSDGNRADKPKTKEALVGALQLSLYVGIALGLSLAVFAQYPLCAMMGKSAADVDPSVMGPAMDYVRIRALSMPAASVLGTLQTAQLGMRDVVSPVIPTVVASLINWVLNFVLVPKLGTAGAAWGTLIANYLALAASLKLLMGPRKQSPKSSGSKMPTRGLLAGSVNLRELLRLPTRETSKAFSSYFLPVTTTHAGRCSASATLDHVVSSSGNPIIMAANSIVTSVFYGLVPLGDSLNLAAQSFAPEIAERKDGPRKAASLLKLQKSFLKAAGLCGAFLAAVMVSMPLGLCNVFTSDPQVMKAVYAIIPIHFIISSMHGIFCASEGLLLGQKDLSFLGRMYFVFAFVVPYLMLRLKAGTIKLSSLWYIFLGLQITRCSLMFGRNVWLQRKAHGDRRRHRASLSFLTG